MGAAGGAGGAAAALELFGGVEGAGGVAAELGGELDGGWRGGWSGGSRGGFDAQGDFLVGAGHGFEGLRGHAFVFLGVEAVGRLRTRGLGVVFRGALRGTLGLGVFEEGFGAVLFELFLDGEDVLSGDAEAAGDAGAGLAGLQAGEDCGEALDGFGGSVSHRRDGCAALEGRQCA